MLNFPLQAGVYELIRPDGTVDKVKVLKAKHKYALLTKMQREWEVGRRISSLKNPERAMPGFMSVGAAVCTDKGTFKGKSPQTMQTALGSLLVSSAMRPFQHVHSSKLQC